ncbi:MAG: isopentenyl phosphate kinase [Halobacteriota archaeon]
MKKVRFSVILLKIGGSVLTDKAQVSTVRRDSVRMVAQQIANAKRRDLVLVHGAGSFGHPQAAACLSKGRSISDAWKTHRAVSSLNTLFINELHSKGVTALPIHPLDSITLDGGRISRFDMSVLCLMLKNGIIPVLHGDIVLDSTDGFNILSGDQIVAFLAQRMQPEKIGIGTDVDGIIYKGEKIAHLNANKFEDYRKEIVGSSVVDVTGGMLHKVSELVEIAKVGIRSEIFNATRSGNITKFLMSNQQVGTIISVGTK